MTTTPYYATVHQLKRFGQGCVDTGNTLIDRSLAVENGFGRRSLRSLAEMLTDSGKLILDFPRMDASLICGDIGRVAYYGANDAVKRALLEALFPHGFEESAQRRVKVWQLPADVHQRLPEHDLVVCRIGRQFPWKLRAPITFDNPIRVHQVVPLAASIDDLLRGRSIRKRLNRYLRQNHHGWLSRQQDDFDWFYAKMYLPSAHHRFGAKLQVQSYDALRSWFQRGMLLLVALDGAPVSGSLIYQQNGTWFDGFSGFLDGDPQWLRQGASAVLYWYSLKLAIEHKARQANFIDSNAWSSDGVFEHKRSWGAVVQEDPYVLEKYVFLADQLSPQWQERVNQLGFLTQTRKGFLRVYYHADAAIQGETDAEKLAEATHMGLHGIRLVSPFGWLDKYGERPAIGQPTHAQTVGGAPSQ